MLTSFLSDLMTAFATTTLLAAVYREVVLDYRANNSEHYWAAALLVFDGSRYTL